VKLLASPRGRFVACALFLLVGWALFFWPVLVDGRVPMFRDILDTTVPLGKYIGDRLREGRLPQWFPYEDLGEPFIGQLNEGTFHPTSWLYAFLPLAQALRWELLLGYLVAGAGQLLLGRKLGFSAVGAALAAVIFAFSGYAISMNNLLPYLWGFASLPWLGLFAVEVCTTDRPLPWVAAMAVCWASIVVVGDSHSALFGGLVVLFVCAVTRRLRRLPYCIASGALALCVAAAELVPAVALVKGGRRVTWGTDTIVSLSSFWSLHPYRLPELFFPRWMPKPILFLLSNGKYREGGVWALSVFVGVWAIALGASGVASRTRRGVLSGLLALLGFWLALGQGGALEPALRHLLPVLNVLRFPEKHLALFTFGLSLAAAAGLEDLRDGKTRGLNLALVAGAGCFLLAAALLPQDIALRVWPQLSGAPAYVPELYDAWRVGLACAAASLAVLAAVLIASRRRPALFAAVPVAVFLELWAGGKGAVLSAPASVLDGTPRFCAAAQSAGAAVDGTRVIHAANPARPIAGMEDPQAWVSATRNMMEPVSSTLCGIGVVSRWPILSNESRLVRRVLGGEHLQLNPVLRAFGFGLVVRAEPEDPPAPDETVIERLAIPGSTLALGVQPAAPRAYAATPRWVANEASAIAALEHPARSVVDAPVLVGAGPEYAGDGPTGTVRIESYAPERVVLEARMDRAGVVVLNDLAARGWTATLDGVPARIYLTNALARGVLAGPGVHRIEMTYSLPGLGTGLAVSAAALLFCIGLGCAGLWPRRAAPDPRALQQAYWAQEDRAHFAWQTRNAYIAGTELELLDAFAVRPGETVLEVGCGEGANLTNLGSRLEGAVVFAIDFSISKAAFVAGPGVRAACADATELPFRSGAFDAVLVRDLLHHVPDRGRVLSEVARVLKPGGRLTLIEPNGRNPVIAAMALSIRAERGMLASTAERALQEARGAGFANARLEAHHHPLPVSRVLLHYRFGLPGLARFRAVRAGLRAIEGAARILPRSLWSYFVVSGNRH
jgi:SAM-dependent methyltransferase